MENFIKKCHGIYSHRTRLISKRKQNNWTCRAKKSACKYLPSNAPQIIGLVLEKTHPIGAVAFERKRMTTGCWLIENRLTHLESMNNIVANIFYLYIPLPVCIRQIRHLAIIAPNYAACFAASIMFGSCSVQFHYNSI